MATITTRPVTAEEFAAFVERPENAGRYFELDEGEIIELPPPKPPHGFVSITVGALLWTYCRQRGRGYLFSNDTGVVLARDPDTVRGPDVMLYDDDTPADEIVAMESNLETPPVLAVEILSPGNRHGQIVRKVAQCLNAGVRLVWVIDPPAQEVTVHRPDAEPDVIGSDGTLNGGDALPRLSIKVAELFRKPGEK
jgi:Uma2 family endonuclease